MHSIPGYRAKYFYEHCLYLKQFTLPALKRSLEKFLQTGTGGEGRTYKEVCDSSVETQDANNTDTSIQDPS